MTTRDLPSGTLTFFFSDTEGSTRLVQRFGAAFGEMVQEHARRIRAAVATARGVKAREFGAGRALTTDAAMALAFES